MKKNKKKQNKWRQKKQDHCEKKKDKSESLGGECGCGS